MHVFALLLGDGVVVMTTGEAEVETVVLKQLQEFLDGELGTWETRVGREGVGEGRERGGGRERRGGGG